MNVQRPTLNAQRPKRPAGKFDAFDLDERLLDYAAEIVRLTERMPDTRAGNHIAGQLLRTGRSFVLLK